MGKIEFDNHDERIRYYELLLERDLEHIPRIELPQGYRFVFYKPGDRDAWIDIEKSAREFINYEQGMVSYGRDKSGDGWPHWVAVRREYQGKGLAKPLIAYVLNVMRELGYKHAKIPTQTNTWLACKIYLDFGFMPLQENCRISPCGMPKTMLQ